MHVGKNPTRRGRVVWEIEESDTARANVWETEESDTKRANVWNTERPDQRG
jgi:hypothetical protein